MFRPLVCQQAGHTHHGAFGGGVRRHADTALEREHGGNIHDLAAVPLRDKVLCRRLGHEKYALDVQIHHVVPVALAEVDRIFTANQPGVVDQNVDVTEFRHRAIQQFRNGIDFTQVGGQAQEAAAQGRHALEGFRRFNDINSDDIAARFRQA